MPGPPVPTLLTRKAQARTFGAGLQVPRIGAALACAGHSSLSLSGGAAAVRGRAPALCGGERPGMTSQNAWLAASGGNGQCGVKGGAPGRARVLPEKNEDWVCTSRRVCFSLATAPLSPLSVSLKTWRARVRAPGVARRAKPTHTPHMPTPPPVPPRRRRRGKAAVARTPVRVVAAADQAANAKWNFPVRFFVFVLEGGRCTSGRAAPSLPSSASLPGRACTAGAGQEGNVREERVHRALSTRASKGRGTFLFPRRQRRLERE